MLPRIHAFEVHDLPWCPAFVRETVVETLGHALRWGRIYDPVAPVFAEFCERAGVERVLDCCSGSGEPVSILIDALDRAGAVVPRFTLSDLFPNTERLLAVSARHPGRVAVCHEPVNATAVPADIDGDARTIISAFHHFSPALARRILEDCVAAKRAVFVLEPTPRRVRNAMGVLAWLAAGAALNPLIAARHRTSKLLGTFAIPLLPAVVAWDSTVSMLRMYTEAELFSLVGGLAGYHWEFREIEGKNGVLVTAFMGWPER